MGFRQLLTVCLLVLFGVQCAMPGAAAHKAARSRPHAAATPLSSHFLVDGKAVQRSAQLTAHSHLQLVLTEPMRPDWVTVLLDGEPLPPAALAWSAERTSLEILLPALLPFRTVTLDVAAAAPFFDPGPLKLSVMPTVPSNPASGIQPGFALNTPMAIVVENSPPARPQSGLQDADVVFEYLSEYSVTRMTAIYFNRVPDTVGPVRSCRMINPYLGFAYTAMTMCSGVSVGTSPWMFGANPGSQLVPNIMEAYDRGAHYFRVGFRAAPHNLYTSGDRAQRLRSEWPQPAPAYAVDPPHDDAIVGQPVDAPSVPLHSVGYSYDGGSRQYYRQDHGQPIADQNSGHQLGVKTVVVMHVGFHDGGWVEDDNGGAHSVWYDMLGGGAAEVYSDGQLVHATWHMGQAGQGYYENHTPVWFTDEAGKLMVLNSGLTWIHVVGNGQDRCPESPSTCG